MFGNGFRTKILLLAGVAIFACSNTQAQTATDLAISDAISSASAYPESLELRIVTSPSVGEAAIYSSLLSSPAHQAVMVTQPMVDRSVLINVLREGNALPLIRFWSSPRSHVYLGVSPTGFAGLNFSQKRPISTGKKKRVVAKDYSTRIRELTFAAREP